MYTNIRLEQFGHIGSVKVETRDGRKFARVSVASKSHGKDKTTGEKKEFTEWLEWTFFNTNTVEFIERYAAKGQYVRIEGKVQQSSYEKNGATVYTNEVRGFRFDFCEPKAPGASQDDGYTDDEISY